jgi:hypothetical protein
MKKRPFYGIGVKLATIWCNRPEITKEIMPPQGWMEIPPEEAHRFLIQGSID